MWTTELLAVIVSACVLCACSKPAPQADSPKSQAATASTVTAKPFSMTSVFPPGSGRDMVLSSCGSRHSIACAARGQRSKDGWESVKKAHADRLTGRSPAEMDVMFAYLEQNFNDTKPEPQFPAELLQQGCTPF